MIWGLGGCRSWGRGSARVRFLTRVRHGAGTCRFLRTMSAAATRAMPVLTVVVRMVPLVRRGRTQLTREAVRARALRVVAQTGSRRPAALAMLVVAPTAVAVGVRTVPTTLRALVMVRMQQAVVVGLPARRKEPGAVPLLRPREAWCRSLVWTGMTR